MADTWTYEPNQGELAQVLELLFDLANDVVDGAPGKQPRAVFTLGGDVHLGAMHVIASSFEKHLKNPFIYQLISPPISNRPIDNTVLLNAARHIQEGKNISHRDVLAAARDPNKWAEGFFDKNPAMFSLHKENGKSFVTQIWELLADRNFGRINVKRVRGDRRVYRFYLSVEGQARSLYRAIELDLDNELVTDKDLGDEGMPLTVVKTEVVHYTAVWQSSNEGEIQVYDWSYEDYRAKYDELWPQGWRLKLLSPYVINNEVRYTAAWQRSTEDEIQLYGWTYEDYRAKYDELWRQGWRLKLLSSYVINNEVRYTAAWQRSTEDEIQLYGWTYEDYRAKYDELWGQGWRLKLLSPYVINNEVRYTAVWQPSTEGEIQVYGWSYEDYRAKYDEL